MNICIDIEGSLFKKMEIFMVVNRYEEGFIYLESVIFYLDAQDVGEITVFSLKVVNEADDFICKRLKT